MKKNNTTSGVDLTKKSTTGNTNDIFKDLSDTKALP